MICPACKDSGMLSENRKGIEIDYCPKCRGVWLDRGELDKIIEQSKLELAQLSGSSVESSTSEPPHKHKRNLITELFEY